MQPQHPPTPGALLRPKFALFAPLSEDTALALPRLREDAWQSPADLAQRVETLWLARPDCLDALPHVYRMVPEGLRPTF